MLTLRSGMFGLKKAGKTIANGVLYKEESREGLDVTVKDQATLRYLRPLATALEKGDVPEPTSGPPTYLKWRVQIEGGGKYELETTDFPGEYLEVIGQEGENDAVLEEALNNFRKQVRDWFVKCDSILLFIDSTSPGTIRYRDALVKLLDEMGRRPTIRGSSKRAIGVVFTKVDEYIANKRILLEAEKHDRDGDSEYGHALLKDHPMYQVVRRRLSEYRENIDWKVFAVSALGWNFLSQANPSERKVEPHNLFSAFRWAITRSAELVAETHGQVLDELEQELKDLGAGDSLFINYKRKFHTLKIRDLEFGLSTGPCSSRFAQLKHKLRRARRSQFRSIAMTGALLVFVLLGWGYQWGRQSQIKIYDTHERMAEEQPGELGVKERVAYYEQNIQWTRWNWFWVLGDRKSRADALAESDRVLLQMVIAEERFVEWSALDERNRKEGKPAHRHRDASAYLSAHGASAKSDRVERVERVIEGTRPAFLAEKSRWNQIAALPAAREDQILAKVRDLREYADSPDALASQEAVALARKTLLGWDRVEYTNLLRATQNRDPEQFEQMEIAASDYLRPNRHGCSMSADVNQFLKKMREIRNGKSYHVTINQVHIPHGSDLWAEARGYPNCSVRVTVGSTTYETNRVKPKIKDSNGGFTININQTIGPFRGQWGNDTATVSVITNRSIFPSNVATETLSHDKLVMMKLDSLICVKCKKGMTVAVSAECADARLSLPGFKY